MISSIQQSQEPAGFHDEYGKEEVLSENFTWLERKFSRTSMWRAPTLEVP